MKLGAAAQAKSRTFFALNRHVRVGLRREERGRVKDWPTSAFAMMGTVVSDLSAVARRARLRLGGGAQLHLGRERVAGRPGAVVLPAGGERRLGRLHRVR